MKLTAPLRLKFWLWLALNLLLLAGLFAVVASHEGPGWRMLLTEPVRDRLVGIGADIGGVLKESEPEQWPMVLAQTGELYGVVFAAGRVPREGAQRDAGMVANKPTQGIERRMRAELVALRGGFVGPFELVIPMPIERAGQAAQLYDLHVQIDDLVGLLAFLGVQNWVMYPLVALGLSALWWLPFVWSITHTVTRLTQTTERVAAGDPDARADEERRDEFGQLAASVNRMASRLRGQMDVQKRSLADVARQVSAPLARLRVALGLLGTSPPGTLAEQTLQDMHDDLQQLADMLEDLLLFSADGAPRARALQPVHLVPTVAAVLDREGAADRVTVRIEPDAHVRAEPAMLERALANLVRNALRYAGEAPIEIAARREGDYVALHVRDRGPGVPESLLPRLGEPFLRPTSARNREGGFGLGLAIVKRCIEASEGQVVLRNREGGGFEAEVRLRVG